MSEIVGNRSRAADWTTDRCSYNLCWGKRRPHVLIFSSIFADKTSKEHCSETVFSGTYENRSMDIFLGGIRIAITSVDLLHITVFR